MHIVISGYFGFDNVGDEAILYSIIESLRAVKPNVNITVLSNNPASTSRTYNVQAVNRRKLKQITQAIRSSDGLISGGGSLLQDKTGMLTIPYYTGVMRIAKFLNKPVFIYAQGMGPISSKLNKWLVKTTLNNVNQITVRDDASKQLLTDIGVTSPAPIVPDPVLGLDQASFSHNWKTSEHLRPFITVSIRDWPTKQAYHKKVATCLDYLVQHGYDIVFVPMHGKQDAVQSKKTADLMKEKSYLFPSDASIQEKIAIIGDSQLLIGMRLHSLIFSAICTTPFVALSYDPKIDAFASLCDQPVIGHVEKDDWGSDDLWETIRRILSMEEWKQAELRRKVSEHQHNAKKTPEMVFETFFQELKCEQSY